jgi:predicted ATPase
LLLLRQSKLISLYKEFPLILNGKYIQLGTGGDVLYEGASQDDISIRISRTNQSYQWTWKVADQEGVLENIVTNVPSCDEGEDFSLLQEEKEQFIHFCYLSAERLGPRTAFRMADENLQKISDLGSQGEFASHYLEIIGNELLPVKELAFSAETPLNILNQLNAWLGIISPGVHAVTRSYRDVDVIKLRFQYDQDKGLSREHRPINVGFGLTYTLPIILAILTARPGALLLIENPEAHLHPKGQTELGILMARAAQNGIQLIVETHSDHLINGVRVAVKNALVSKEKALIQFFSNSVTTQGTNAQRITIDQNGKIDNWPEDFLAEWESNLLKLI